MKGSCLCGQVNYEVEPPLKVFQLCHCTRCRKYTGSAHASHIFAKPENFRWTKGEELVGRFNVPDTKYFATSFCKTCGSSLPWEIQGGGNMVITAGTLDEDPGIKPEQNIFWADHAPWYEGAMHLPKNDALPVKKK